jgi:DNA-binding response OmpR family regulator
MTTNIVDDPTGMRPRHVQVKPERFLQHIFAVENAPEFREILRMALESDGSCRVTTASTAEDAITMMMRDPPDAAIIDAVLPGLSGLHLAHWSLSRGVPVLLVTGEPAMQQELRKIGCHYLKKPFRLATLRAETRALWVNASERRTLLATSLQRAPLNMAAWRAVVDEASRTAAQSKAARAARALRNPPDQL